jgi:cytochrome c556
MAQILAILFAIVVAAEQAAEPVAVVDTGELMDIFLKPAYAELQQAMAKPPADRKDWATIYQKAVRLAELENLLFFRNHEDARKPEWLSTSARARQAAAEVASAALLGLRTVKAENYDGVRAKYERVADTCNACHRTFARDAVTVKP